MSSQDKNWSAFRQGYDASRRFNSDPGRAKNPYEYGTDKFYSWNQGWNSHYDETWDNPWI